MGPHDSLFIMFLAHYSLFILKKGHYSLITKPHPDPHNVQSRQLWPSPLAYTNYKKKEKDLGCSPAGFVNLCGFSGGILRICDKYQNSTC